MQHDPVTSRAQYLAWLRTNFPDLYEDATASIREDFQQRQLSGFFDTIGTAFNSIVTNVSQALPQLAQTYAQYGAQKDLLRANTTRANQGLPPLQYNAQGQLVTTAGLPYTAEDYQLAQRGSKGLDQNTMLLIVGALVLLLVILFSGGQSVRR